MFSPLWSFATAHTNSSQPNSLDTNAPEDNSTEPNYTSSSIYKNYHITPVVILTSSWTFIIFFFLIFISNQNSSFFTFGPSDDCKFFNFIINSWSKWSFVIIYSFFSQFINSLINSTLYPFITNVIRDHKTPWDGSLCYAQIIALTYKLYYWLNEICDLFLVFTFQLQYWMPALVADIIVSLWTTANYLETKQLINIYNNVNPNNSINIHDTSEDDLENNLCENSDDNYPCL